MSVEIRLAFTRLSDFTREYAINYGVAGYSKDLGKAMEGPRVVGNPPVIKGTGVEETNKTDGGVASSDAFKIRG